MNTLPIEALHNVDSPATDEAFNADDKGVYPIACRNAWANNEGSAQGFFRAGWSKDELRIDFLLCDNVFATHLTDQSAVSQDSCVEFFVEPRAGGEYWNFEMNCVGKLNASHRLTRPEPVRLTADELASVKRSSTVRGRRFGTGIEPVELRPEGLSEWTCSISIPWRLIGVEPYKGMRMRANVYFIASKAQCPHYLSYAPIVSEKPDFHRPEFFADFVLV